MNIFIAVLYMLVTNFNRNCQLGLWYNNCFTWLCI